MRETLKHRDAFEAYYKMQKRSCSNLAVELGVKPETVEKWSRELHWQKRVEERDKEIADKVAEKNISEEVDIRTNLYGAVNDSINIYRKMVKNKDSINLETVRVIDTLGRLWKELELPCKGEVADSQVETVTELEDDVEPTEQLKPSE